MRHLSAIVQIAALAVLDPRQDLAFGGVVALELVHPRLIRPVEQVFGEKLYMHQYKINAKAAFEGDVWQWHQDYGTWARDDGMPEPRAMNIAVFLDEVM